MMTLLRAATFLTACLLAAALPRHAAEAADFPTKPIRLIVPYAPGGFVDITARTLAPGMSQELGQQIVVENRGGAGGVLGLITLLHAPADGYTLAVSGGTSLSASPLLYPKVATYDGRKDFTLISLASETPLIMVLGRATKINSIKEFVDYAKANPGKLTMGSAGNGTTNHLTGELMKMLTGTDFVHVPYKGSGEALNDLIGGHIDFVFDQIPASIGFIDSGQARAIGITAGHRSAKLPNVPTFEEAGYPEVRASTALGIMGPAGLPAEVVARLNAAILATLAKPETREAITRTGAEPLGGTPAEFAARVEREYAVWARVIKVANIKTDD